MSERNSETTFDCPNCYGRPRGQCPNCGQIGCDCPVGSGEGAWQEAHTPDCATPCIREMEDRAEREGWG